MDTSPIDPTELKSFFSLVSSLGSVGWGIVAWMAFAAKNALVELCKSAGVYLKSIADSNTSALVQMTAISHDIKNLRMELQAVYQRIDDHEREHHGLTNTQSGPRFIRRSSTLRRDLPISPPDEDTIP